MRYVDENTGKILDPSRSVKVWEEGVYCGVSMATHTQWCHERLHKTSAGNYWVEKWGQWEGSRSSGRLVSPEEAARWLLQNDVDENEFPEDLVSFVEGLYA